MLISSSFKFSWLISLLLLLSSEDDTKNLAESNPPSSALSTVSCTKVIIIYFDKKRFLNTPHMLDIILFVVKDMRE